MGNSKNNRVLDFTIYLPNFVYWVGFVTGITFTTHLWIVNFIDVLTCWGKSAFKPGLLFLRKRSLCSNLFFSSFSAEALYHNVHFLFVFGLRAIHTFWYKGSAEDKDKWQVRKRAISLKNSSLDSEADFSEKSLLGIWRLILSRCDIVLVRYDIISII